MERGPRPFYQQWLTLSGVFGLLQLLSITFILPCVNSISFNIPRFDSGANNILYQGAARPNVGAVEFNSLTYVCQVGRIIFAEKVTSFTSHFSFIIDSQGKASSEYSAGLAFFLAPVGSEIPPNSAGGFLGLFNTTTIDSSGNQVVLVEFDTFSNTDWDPEVEHVGININSISSVKYAPWNFSLYSEDTADAWISYNATTRNLSVTWNYQNSSSQGSLSHQIDLTEILPETAIVGFSAATSHRIERHQLVSWEFNSSLERKAIKEKNTNRITIVIGVAVPLGVLVIRGCIGFQILLCWKRRKRSYQYMEGTFGINDDFERGAGPKRFSYKDLVAATNSFSSERKLGEGGFGAVYKGYINELDRTIAVKKISEGSRQGEKEYVTEVKVISQLRHRNLVQLIGFCHDGGMFLLVYVFMSNGSLDSHLFGKKTPLNWNLRYKAARGVASALLYIHEEWEQCVVHRDIKPSNIMLDSNFNVKLGDFGLARLMDHELGPRTTGLAGTLGYMAPEYIKTGRACKASDVYSFGVVALEIATGRRSVDPIEENSQIGLVEWVWHLYGSGNLLSLVDKRMNAEFDEKQMECLMIVGLWCAHPDSNLRPSIKQVIQVLDFDMGIPNLPSKMPIPTYQEHVASSSSHEPILTNSSLEVGR
ncbi:hypothetical protein ES288_D11G241800v1 [Gossypium darwinii]|uniref:Protein kinase domain-containing protein n=1 Tax=Gossypium darwinii TaxID=34276 RepID=A0A5D2ASS8_GOSDA|nr:hypothetical protein ES288_D11G241800v1 [Gossypium darwinii]